MVVIEHPRWRGDCSKLDPHGGKDIFIGKGDAGTGAALHVQDAGGCLIQGRGVKGKALLFPDRHPQKQEQCALP